MRNTEKRCHTDHLAFFDDEVGMQRFDIVRHPMVEKFTNTQLSFFWRPEEVDVTEDRADFESMSEGEKHIFTSNLQRQIMLDTVQGREPLKAFLPLASTPEMECANVTWSFSETIHSRSYTHIIRGVTSNPSEIFDKVTDIPEIMELKADLDKYYNDLEHHNFLLEAKKLGYNLPYNEYQHKKSFYLAMVSVNALEAIRFYVSFACSFAMMQILEKMEGNAKIIKLISRDEQLHLTFTQRILNRILPEDPDFVKITEECRDESVEIFLKVAQQEKDWAKYLFKEGAMLGLNETICRDYIDWLTKRRMSAVGMEYPLEAPDTNPLPWMDHWTSSAAKQTALQEAENDSYLVGAVEGSDSDVRTRLKKISERFKEEV
ncbi:ribonucleotide reductase small chain [Vibrio phage 1.121.O._10N.286.46.C4]|nr:ribonucleotide reductase small chain [Vibrio phage 1.121.O._10N.286.46.C4]